MSEFRQRVAIAQVATPVVLTDVGPPLEEVSITSFEGALGYRLPDSYREFLLRHNGGKPVIGEVRGRDDDPHTPYAHGDAVRIFYRLRPPNAVDSGFYGLRLPKDHPWELPDHALPIAGDSFGNEFVLELGEGRGQVRFIDHDRLDDPFERHRVMAKDFLDLLLRFWTAEEAQAFETATRDAERLALEKGAFPARLSKQCGAVAMLYPDVGSWLRRAALKIFHAKGHLSIHNDDASHEILDLAFWLAESTSPSRGLSLGAFKEQIERVWWQEQDEGFGLKGIAIGFVDHWWKVRQEQGWLEASGSGSRFTKEAARALLGRYS